MSHTRSMVLPSRASSPPPPRPSVRAQFRLMRGLLHTPESVLTEVRSTIGPVCGLGAWPLRVVILGAPATIRELLMQPNDRFRWDHPISPFPFVVGETTMLAADGADHRRRRGAVQEAFSRRRLDRWIPMIVERADAAIDVVLAGASGGTPVDLYPWGKRLIIDIVVRALFGERLTDRTDEIEARFQRIQDYLSAPLWRQAPHPFPFGSRAGVREDREALDAMLDREIAQIRRGDDHDPFDILAALVGRGDLTDAEIRDQVKTLIGAGYDSTSSSLTWLIWEASLSPGLWERMRAEANVVLDRPLDEVSLPSLDLAGRVVHETLRLHPASGVAPRVTAVDIDVGGVAIRRGTIAMWSPYLAGRDPAVWTDPLRFDPDRFVALDDAQRAAADLAWLPFGRGPRSCIGFALAQMELTLIAARMAQRLDLAPSADDVPPAEGLVVSKPVGGAPMLVGAAR
jgi:cytochrome P450